MWAFLTGAAAAVVLATATFFVLEYGAITSVEAVDDVSIIVDDHVGNVASQQ